MNVTFELSFINLRELQVSCMHWTANRAKQNFFQKTGLLEAPPKKEFNGYYGIFCFGQFMLLYVTSFINCEQSVIFFKLLTFSLLIVVKEKFTEKRNIFSEDGNKRIFLCNVVPRRFHFNGNTLGFHPQMKSYPDK